MRPPGSLANLLVLLGPAVDLGLGEVGCAAAAAVLVLGSHHLLDVLHLKPSLLLEGAGGSPIDQVGAAAGISPGEEDQNEDDEPHHPQG